jgi:hypothetical protein
MLMSKGVFYQFSIFSTDSTRTSHSSPSNLNHHPIASPSCTVVPFSLPIYFHPIALALFYWTREARLLLSPRQVDDRSDTECSACFNNIIIIDKPNIIQADKLPPELHIFDNNNEQDETELRPKLWRRL